MKSLPDPLGVRAGAAFVMERARHVRINENAAVNIAERILTTSRNVDDWKASHLSGMHLTEDELANYILVLDALNFCFWGEPRWRVSLEGRTENGYWALTLALRRAISEGFPITDAGYLATIPAHDVAMILRGESVIPLFAARLAHLREIGTGLVRDYEGNFSNCVREANGSVVEMLRRIITTFPSFVDVASYQSRTIPFYKRAQILVSDLTGALDGSALGTFRDAQTLTAFADYKVPQVLLTLGVLQYSSNLVFILERHEPIPPGSDAEVEIRAGTIVAVELIAAQCHRRGLSLPAYEVDWYLWQIGQETDALALPYHRTRTSAY